MFFPVSFMTWRTAMSWANRMALRDGRRRYIRRIGAWWLVTEVQR